MKTLQTIIILVLFFTFTTALFAQDTEEKKPDYGWKKEAIGILNFTQNQFDNWSQGGENSWSWQMAINAKFVNDQQKYNWATSGKLSYGKAKVGDGDAKKAADEIKLESVYTYKMGVHINPYVAVTGLTQITDGYLYTSDTTKMVVSSFMDPGYFTQSVGVGFTPNSIIKTRLGAALKETVTDKFSDTYADGESFRTEFGLESVTDISWEMYKNILYTSKLELFSGFSAFNEIDVNWDNMFSSKISDFITVSFNLKLFYDKDVSASRQLKQTLAVGLSYNLL